MAENITDTDLDIRVVKMTLNGFCNDKTRKPFVARVQALVATMNVAMAEAYLFANFHITRCLSDPNFDVSKLPKLDRHFYYRCILAVSTCNPHKNTLGEELKETMIAYDALRPVGYQKADIILYNQVVADLSIQMATMACNSVWANIRIIIRRFLQAKHTNLKTEWNKIIDAVVKCPNKNLGELFDPSKAKATEASTVAALLRSWLPFSLGKQFNTRAHLAMGLFHKILGELSTISQHMDTKIGRRYKPRLFNLLPRKGTFTLAYMPISSMTLVKLLTMGDKGETGDEPIHTITGCKDGREEDIPALWRKFFNVNSVETRRARFDNRILTDGKGVSIQIRVSSCDLYDVAGYPKDADPVNCSIVAEEGLTVAVDPGMTDVATCAFSTGEVKSFSSSQFSQQAGYYTSARRTKKWNAETAELVASIPTSKVASLDGMIAHVRGYLKVLKELLSHRATKGYRSMRFFRYVGKQKTIEKVCDMIAPRDKFVVVGFGNWNNSGCGISRRCSGPITEIRKRVAARPNVMYKNVDEFRSSCTCHNCFKELYNMKASSVKWKMIDNGRREKVVVKSNKVHKVLHCHNSVCGATWNRDVNAAKNILLLLNAWMDGKDRPLPFSRSNVFPEACGANYRVRPNMDAEVSTSCYPGNLPSRNIG